MLMKGKGNGERRGFTLVELLVVISIIALLIAILLPSLKGARDQAKDAVGRSNLHQLGIGTLYYAEANGDRLPYIIGTDQGSGQPNNAPYYQYHQIFHYWPYLKNLELFICPRAKGKTSVKFYESGSPTLPSYYNDQASYYTVQKGDSYFQVAYEQRWFPDIDPYSIDGDLIPQLYTEYWLNDWSEGATSGTQQIPGINGSPLNRIPLPEHAIIMGDARWEDEPRHSGANQFVFLDAHVERIAENRYLDPEAQNLPANSSYVPKDQDAFGNAPFYCWGLTKWGFDARRGG